LDRIEEYKRIRERLVAIHGEILGFLNKEDIFKVAKDLGVVENRAIVFESELEREALMDFTIYREGPSGKSKIAEYIESNEKARKEENLLRAMVTSETSLYEVTNVNRKNKTIKFEDVLNGLGTFTVVDLNMSETIDVNALVFTRLIHLDDFSITSGLIFNFRQEHREYLQRISRKRMKKVEAENDSDKRLIAFLKIYRRDGIPFMLREVR